MTDLIRIQDVTAAMIGEALSDAMLAGGTMPSTDVLGAFVGRIDWSGDDALSAPMAETIGEIASVLTLFAEKMMDEHEYVAFMLAKFREVTQADDQVPSANGITVSQQEVPVPMAIEHSALFLRTGTTNSEAADVK